MTASGPSSVTSRRRVLIAMAGSLQGVAPAASSASEETAHPERPVYAAQATIKSTPKSKNRGFHGEKLVNYPLVN